MNEIFTAAGILIITAGFILILRQYRPEFAFGAALAAGIIFLFYIITILGEAFSDITGIIEFSGIGEERFGILLRCFGIGFVSKIASETCRDCGEAAFSSKIDLFAKTMMLVVSLPLFFEIFDIITELINL